MAGLAAVSLTKEAARAKAKACEISPSNKPAKAMPSGKSKK